eukprot:gnl/TRDRNA2_/TRDRNA2_199494_c0_seq1.p1 gnl/TRDRNA2_/TRDRNA2_199494_c0~~gnl/TRDRNA2_/TRDRNA2_199494_c0_seq1.p1  ORF type:complete len:475 (+),score=57.73 gnl/TRDRNA2_/TRDRNA2_199494_c0_seq1:124-1548(+)
MRRSIFLLVSTAWPLVATAGPSDDKSKLLDSLARTAKRRLGDHNLSSIISGLSKDGGVKDARSLFEHLKKSAHSLSPQALSSLVKECEKKDLSANDKQLLTELEGNFSTMNIGSKPGQGPSEISMPRQRPPIALDPGMWRNDTGPLAPYSKELRLLAYVISTAEPGDPASVCKAIEHYGLEVLDPAGLFLKIAAGIKAEVYTSALKRAPKEGGIMEIGTYVAYSAIRIAMAVPDCHIVSMEVDPVHVIISRNMLAFAGLSHRVDVWTGHSKDLLYRVHKRYLGKDTFPLRGVFMDHKGSRFAEDLSQMEKYGLLRPDAVVVADNTLSPGSPLLLWRLVMSGSYNVDVVRVKEFIMTTEDWMSISSRKPQPTPEPLPNVSAMPEPVVIPECPGDLIQASWESDKVRLQSLSPGQGVSFREWAAFANEMKQRYKPFGIKSTTDARDVIDGEGLANLDKIRISGGFNVERPLKETIG